MDIIGWTCTRALGQKIAPSKCMNRRLEGIDKDNYKREGKRIMIGKTWESSICDGEIT